MSEPFVPKIMVLATEKCAYPGADAVGKAHQEYPSNVYILRVLSPLLFPQDFYLRTYSKGIDGILIAACGSDCPLPRQPSSFGASRWSVFRRRPVFRASLRRCREVWDEYAD